MKSFFDKVATARVFLWIYVNFQNTEHLWVTAFAFSGLINVQNQQSTLETNALIITLNVLKNVEGFYNPLPLLTSIQFGDRN